MYTFSGYTNRDTHSKKKGIFHCAYILDEMPGRITRAWDTNNDCIQLEVLLQMLIYIGYIYREAI